MRTPEGFKTTIIGIMITKFKQHQAPGDHEKLEATAERILELIADEMTRAAWKAIRAKYKNSKHETI